MDYPQNLSEADRHWFDLIQQCRTSGKSDFQWLQENNIKSPTFYYHVKRLRKKACEIPEPIHRSSRAEVQEVVPVFFKNEDLSIPAVSTENVISEVSENAIAIRLQIHGVCVEISNAASQTVIQNTISALRSLC